MYDLKGVFLLEVTKVLFFLPNEVYISIHIYFYNKNVFLLVFNIASEFFY